jgi:hypothetical protein
LKYAVNVHGWHFAEKLLIAGEWDTTDEEGSRFEDWGSCGCDWQAGAGDRLTVQYMPSQQYLVIFAQAHEDFRVPELLSIAELHGFPLSMKNDLDPSRPFGVLVLEQEEHVRLLARRCILIK